MTLPSVEPAEEILPGYVLTDRLGSGGYAEVWRACAPGGIEKAVKIVHGYHDDEFAVQELKAMERIKDVRHPFLLSLERFEVVDGRLAILTELADMSLDQRYRKCRADGLPGIPRDELLRYISDAAEALDFLGQRHGLQHLDIKPENLLILGEHIKVADFGLVKELTSRTQNSLIAGMTPTYSPPEMFDDSPSKHSDQYSLAIVYQQMLVGTLPFPGRTAAQLAKQHTQAAPQLQSLPSHDRTVVARALAKLPADRFPTCRAFVDALRKMAPQQVEKQTSLAKPEGRRPASIDPDACDDDTKSAANSATEPRDRVRRQFETQPVHQAPSTPSAGFTQTSVTKPLPKVHREIADVAAPDFSKLVNCGQPTLYIAAGGIGIRILSRLRELIAPLQPGDGTSALVEMLALDTDRGDIRQATSSNRAVPIPSADALHLPLRPPKEYDDLETPLEWISRRWLYNIPRSLETRGYRPLGRIALVDHEKRVVQAIENRLRRLAGNRNEEDKPSGPPVRVVILAGIGGGTGAGISIDLATATKSTAASCDVNAEVHGFFACNSLGDATTSVLSAANAFAFLTELFHASRFGNMGVLSQEDRSYPFESPGRPFDEVYILPLRNTKSDSPDKDMLESVAKYLSLELATPAGAALRACRATPTPLESELTEPLLLRTFGYFSISDYQRVRDGLFAASLKVAVKRRWLQFRTENTIDSSLGRSSKLKRWRQSVTGNRLFARGKKTDPHPSDLFDAEKVLAEFGRHASSQLAAEVVAEIEGRFAALGKDAFQESKSLLTTIGTLIKSLQFLADGMERELDATSTDVEHVPKQLVQEASRRVSRRIVAEFDTQVCDPRRLVDWIDTLIDAEIQDVLLPQQLEHQLPCDVYAEDDVKQGILPLNDRLLGCGFDRRTLAFVSTDHNELRPAVEILRERPTAELIHGKFAEQVIVLEGSGICPRSVAAGFLHVYPGIQDAARRLHSRTDIEWSGLLG